MPPITTDQTFPSLLAFKAALRDWAIERNFTPHILDSDSHRVRAGCRTSPNCPFRIRCNWNEKRATARVTTCEDVHTCLSSTTQALAHQHQDIKRAETGRLKFLLEVVPQLLDVTVTTTTSAIIDAVEQRYGQRIPLRQAQKVKREMAGRIHGPCRYCHRGGHSKRNCPMRKEREASGITIPPTPEELSIDPSFQYANNDNTTPEHEHHDDHQQQQQSPEERRCTLCFQPGHHRGNCRNNESINPDNHPSNIHPDFRNGGPSSSQPSGYPIPYDPVNHDEIYGTSPLPPTPGPSTQQDEPLTTPTTTKNSVSSMLGQDRQQPMTPKEKQAEAARLMQQAAKLMNEAAMMNAEAARLTASINVS
ncbi:MAG: hypothetical protein L6R42_007843 [Xanthoria sp. 1 TBL-2021]|nr:MAG: hypothetical protein L6R42_007843 [Xanthoria sp. 1 TBL-2021]